MALRPRVSEKAYGVAETLNTYIFDVPLDATKHTVADAVTAQYEVTVTAVRIARVPGKSVRSYRRGGRRAQTGQRSDIRKAYVTLKEGDKLPFFASEEAGSKNPSANAQGKGDK